MMSKTTDTILWVQFEHSWHSWKTKPMTIFLTFHLGEFRLADPELEVEPQNNPNNNCPNAPELRGLDTYSSQNITFHCIESDIKKRIHKNTSIWNIYNFFLCTLRLKWAILSSVVLSCSTLNDLPCIKLCRGFRAAKYIHFLKGH